MLNKVAFNTARLWPLWPGCVVQENTRRVSQGSQHSFIVFICPLGHRSSVTRQFLVECRGSGSSCFESKF